MELQKINKTIDIKTDKNIFFEEHNGDEAFTKDSLCNIDLENVCKYNDKIYFKNTMKKHYHEYLEIIYVVKGFIEVCTVKDNILVNCGEVIIVGGKKSHNIKSLADNGYCQSLHIKYNFLEKYLNCDELSTKIFKVQDIHNILYYIKNIIMYLENRDYISQIKYKANILMLLTSILEDKNYNENVNKDFINGYSNNVMNNIICYIKFNYRENITLNSIAQKFNYTPQNISILFKKNLGKTFHRYLTDVRLENSMDLLLNSNKKIVEIALELGFPNEMSFINKFKRKYNMTPNLYRKSNKNK